MPTKFNAAMRAMAAIYYDHCAELAQVFLEKINEAKEITTARKLEEYVSEVLQKDDWIHNPDMIRCVYFVSRSRDNHLNYRNDCDDANKAWHAFRADVEEILLTLLNRQLVTMAKPWACKKCHQSYDASADAINCECPSLDKDNI